MPIDPLSVGHQTLALLKLGDPSSSTIREKLPGLKQLVIRNKNTR